MLAPKEDVMSETKLRTYEELQQELVRRAQEGLAQRNFTVVDAVATGQVLQHFLEWPAIHVGVGVPLTPARTGYRFPVSIVFGYQAPDTATAAGFEALVDIFPENVGGEINVANTLYAESRAVVYVETHRDQSPARKVGETT